METGYFKRISLPKIGAVWVATTRHGICTIKFGGSQSAFVRSLPEIVRWTKGKHVQTGVLKWLRGFASGRGAQPRGGIDLKGGTPFQRKVWRAIARIPRGETRSYSWLARAVGRPKAVRAAANACGANPIPIFIPCHRVVASDGSLGGFSGGIAIKRKMLRLEGISGL